MPRRTKVRKEKRPVRILIADDHAIVRRGVRALIRAHPGWEVCAEAATGVEAVRETGRHRPEVAIIDVNLPEADGVEVTRRIRAMSPATRVLLFSVHDAPDLVRDGLSAGAEGYLLKSAAEEHLIGAVSTLLAGHRYLDPAVAGAAAGGLAPAGSRPREAIVLTSREREVLRLIAGGRSTKEIGAELGISAKTADTHRSNLMRKLDLHTVADLVRYAVRRGIVLP